TAGRQMTELGESSAVTSITDEEIEENHYAGVRYLYPNGAPYRDTICIETTVNNCVSTGVFNFKGESIQSMLDPGTTVQYEIEKDIDPDLSALRKEIKATLDGIIKAEREDTARQEAQLERESIATQGLIYLGAFMSGVGEGAMGLVEFVGDGLELGGKALLYKIQVETNVLEAAWEKYAEGDEKAFFDSVQEKNVEDFAMVFGVTPGSIRAKMARAYEMMAFIVEDSETQDMLEDFALDYVKAQSSVEAVNIAGAVAFDIILAALLAATTGGAGNVAQGVKIAANVRHTSRLGALGKQLSKLVGFLKRKKLRRTVKGKLDEITDITIKQPEKPKLKKNENSTFKSKDKGEAGAKDKNTQSDKKNGTTADADGPQSTDKNGTTKDGTACQQGSKTCTGGEPVSLITGEEMLTLVDFEMDGPLPLSWARTYRSSNPDNIGLGHGWTHPFAESLEINATEIELHDAEGRVIPFKKSKIGQNSENRAEKLNLKRLSTKAYVLTSTTPGAKIERYFDIQSGSSTLKLVEIRDEHGNQHHLSYHQGRLQRIRADYGDVWQLHYSEQGLLSGVQWQMNTKQNQAADPRSQKTLVEYHYDQHDDLISAADSVGNTEHYGYHNHLLTRRQLKSGYSFYFKWDSETPKARCIRNWGDKINDQPTYDYRFQWDTENRRVAITDTRGGVETYQFNERGLPVYHKDGEGGESHYQYDHLGNLSTQIDPLGHKEHFTYDSNNELAAYTSKEGNQQRLMRDYQGRVTQITDAPGQNWLRKYNNYSQLISQSNPLGETHQYEYNELGLVSRITDPMGSQWHYIWDHQARLTAIRNPLGQHTRYTHNAEGQLTQISWPDKQVTKYQYDANNNCIAIKAPDGQVSQFAYNPLGLLTHHKDNSNRVTEYQYNGLSQVVRRIDPGKQTLDYHYDGERNLIGLTNEKGEHYQLKYDLSERLIQEIGFDGRIQRYQYNLAGQLIDSADYSDDGKGPISHISYQRDPQGRLLTQTSNLTRQPLNAFNYDSLGRLTHAKNAHQQLQWEYDPAGRIIKDHQGKQVTEHQYNKAGQRTGSTLPSGAMLDYQFDEAGSFSGLDYNGESVARIHRDVMGRETQRTLSNQLVTDHSYDPQGRLQRQSTYKQKQGEAPSTAHVHRFLTRLLKHPKPHRCRVYLIVKAASCRL
ncbi:Rhs-family protein, partial [hydrothermal vent metagenome]